MTQLMAHPRLKAYEIPHKAIRNLMAQVNWLAGSTDFSDSAQVTRLRELGRTLFRFLTQHAIDENEVTLARLEQRQPGAAQHNMAEHEIIEAQQAHLEELLESLAEKALHGEEVSLLADQFYLEINRFQSGYLQHMLEEEEETQRLLWNNFTDKELLEIRGQVIARIPPADLLVGFRFAIPYLSHPERVKWLRGVKAQAPAPFFSQVMDTVRSALNETDFRRLEQDLSGL